MALGMQEQSPDYQTTNKDKETLDSKTDSGSNGDLEADNPTKQKKSRFGSSNKAVGARIAPVLPHLAAYDFGSDDSSSDVLGKQIALEADNAIQYRTCTWQKVLFPPRLGMK